MQFLFNLLFFSEKRKKKKENRHKKEEKDKHEANVGIELTGKIAVRSAQSIMWPSTIPLSYWGMHENLWMYTYTNLLLYANVDKQAGSPYSYARGCDSTSPLCTHCILPFSVATVLMLSWMIFL